MSELIAELLLRLAKVLAAGLVGVLIYAIATQIDPAASGGLLAVSSLAAGAGVLLLLESSPL